MGKGVAARYSKGAWLAAQQQHEVKRNSLPETLPSVHHERRVSFPLLPSHAMLGSQLSREASKSFWSQQMLRDMEQKMKEDKKLPPIHHGSHVMTDHNSSGSSSASRKPSYDCQQQQQQTRLLQYTSSSYRNKLPNNMSVYGQA